MEFEQTQCKESIITHDYSRKTLAEDRGWYFQLHLHVPTYQLYFKELHQVVRTVIKKLKVHLARNGVNKKLVTGNGLQFVSAKF